jgi:hypothetical protein
MAQFNQNLGKQSLLKAATNSDAATTQLAQNANSAISASAYFTPAFNGAVFDGPVRIYFAQYQESLALTLYFKVREAIGDRRPQRSSVAPRNNLFILLYPSLELFNETFVAAARVEAGGRCHHESGYAVSKMGDEIVIGIAGIQADMSLSQVAEKISLVLSSGLSQQVLDTLNELRV